MTQRPLANPTPDELSFAFAANLFELFRAMARLPEAELDETGPVARHHAFPMNPMFKGAWHTRLAPESVDDAIVDTKAWFSARKAPFVFWWVDPLATPADLGPRLVAQGFAPWEVNAPGMAARLDALRYDTLAKTPPGYTQERVTDEAGLRDFKTAFNAGLEVPDWAGQAWVDATRAFGIEHAPWQMYVGRLNGRPVASNMLFNGAGVASVFGVATVPDARGQGIGAAITLIAYEEALAQGYRYGVLFGTESGVPVYRRIGFQEVGATISRYVWRA